MFNLNQYSGLTQITTLCSVAFLLIALVASLNCLWRSHKMLKTFIWLCIISIFIFSIKKILVSLGINQFDAWFAISQYFDLLQSFFFMLATIEFYRILRRLDGENPPKKK